MRKLLAVVAVAFAALAFGASAAQADTILDLRDPVTGQSCAGDPCPVELEGWVTVKAGGGIELPCQVAADGIVWEDGSAQFDDPEVIGGNCYYNNIHSCDYSTWPPDNAIWYGQVAIIESMTSYQFNLDVCVEGPNGVHNLNTVTLNLQETAFDTWDLDQVGETAKYKNGSFTLRDAPTVNEIEG